MSFLTSLALGLTLTLAAASAGFLLAQGEEARPACCILCGDRNPAQYIAVPMCQPCVGEYTSTGAVPE